MTAARRWVREPLVHFALAGALLFAVHHWVQRRPARGPRIAVDEALLDSVAGSFRRAWLRAPTRDELAEMVLDRVDDEVLYREALALRLDQDDPAVRRRLIEKITVREHQPVPEPTTEELRRWYDERRHHFREPARWWFRQLFLDPRRRAALNDDARAALARLAAGEEVGGDPSPLPGDVAGLPEVQVAHLFGRGFLESLAGLELGRWQGPLSSTRGLHLVRVIRRLPARDPTFAEAQAAVRADWISARSKGYQDAAARLLPRYRIEVAPAARRRLDGAALLGPLLRAAR